MDRNTASPRASTTIETATPIPAPTRARRWSLATYTPSTSRTMATTGSHTPRVLSRLKALRARVMSWDWNSTKEAFTSGIRAATENPASTSRCLTTWMKAARLTLTVSFSTVTDPPPSPVRALTSSSWAARLAWTQASAKASLSTTLATWLRVKLWTPLAIGTARARSWSARAGGRSRSARASTAWLSARGATVATYRSVLVTWLRVQMAATDSGASTQATTISRVATIVRQRR